MGDNGSMRVREGDDPTFRDRAFSLDTKGIKREYEKVFRENLKRYPQWKRWKSSGEVTLNESQTVIAQRIGRREGKFLDVGCGPGFLVGALIATGKDAYGCDISEEAIHFAQDAAGPYANHFWDMPIEDLDKLGDDFDVVMCNQVLEHVREPEKAMQAMWRRLRIGGVLIVSVPLDGDNDLPYYIHEFTEERVKDLARAIREIDDDRWPFSLDQNINNNGDRFWTFTIEKKALEIRYMQVGGTQTEVEQANDIAGDGRIKTGVFNWLRLFQGHSVNLHQLPDPNDFDVVHVQLSGTNFDAPRQVRERISGDTKLVVNLDYAPEFWYMYPPFPDQLLFQLSQADHIFCVEPEAAALLTDVLGRYVHTIPHPADVDAIKERSVPKEKRRDALVVMHRDNQDYLPYWILKGTGLKTRLVGRLTAVSNATGSAIDYPVMHYNYITEGYLGGEQMIDLMSQHLVAVDSYTHHVTGRSAIELAALGVPTIGYDCVMAQRECFPLLTVSPGQTRAARGLVQQLLEGDDWYSYVAEYAQNAVQHFNYENARERFLKMLNGGEANESGSVHAEAAAEVRPAADSPVEQPAGVLSGTESG